MEGLRLFHGLVTQLPEFVKPAFEALRANLNEPFVGLTTDGNPRAGLVSAADGPPTASVAAAAHAFLHSLSRPDQRQEVVQPRDHPYRRWWFNAFPDWMPTGLLLDDLDSPQREAAMAVVAASMSPEGYAEARKVMRLNGLLGEFVDTYVDSLGEWTYFFTIFGEPRPDEAWAWQLMGHHLDLNCLVMPNHQVLTPMFMGAEFNDVKGVTVFEPQAELALAFARSLTPEQQSRAILHPTMNPAELPPELAGPVDGRHIGGAGRDNLVCPYAGLAGIELDADQREDLVTLVDAFLTRMPEAQRKQRLAEVRQHLDATHFAWIGDPAAGAPFYYRVHSPVIWLEFDHHQGIFLDNDLPEPYHVHTIIRTPNGADYGADLVALPETDVRGSA
jgi:hypothetical protein